MPKTATIADGIRKLPSGRYQGRYKAPDGTRRTLGTFDTAKDAQKAILLKEQEEIAHGTWLDERKAETHFTEFAWQVFDYKERTLKRSTVVNHRALLKHWILPAFGNMALKDVRPRHVDEWFNSKAKTVQRQHAYALLNNYMNFAVRWEYIAANPCRVQGGFADPSAQRPAWGVADFRKVLEATDKEFKPVLLVAFGAHLRAGEVMGLNVGDFDAQNGTLTISRSLSNSEGLKETKTGKVRVVTMMAQGADALRGHIKKRGAIADAPMFANTRGTRIKHAWVRENWKAACAKAGIEGMRFHDIRHISLTRIAHTGASLKEIMARGGHSTVVAALRYQAATSTRDAEIAAKASALFG